MTSCRPRSHGELNRSIASTSESRDLVSSRRASFFTSHPHPTGLHMVDLTSQGGVAHLGARVSDLRVHSLSSAPQTRSRGLAAAATRTNSSSPSIPTPIFNAELLGP